MKDPPHLFLHWSKYTKESKNCQLTESVFYSWIGSEEYLSTLTLIFVCTDLKIYYYYYYYQSTTACWYHKQNHVGWEESTLAGSLISSQLVETSIIVKNIAGKYCDSGKIVDKKTHICVKLMWVWIIWLKASDLWGCGQN